MIRCCMALALGLAATAAGAATPIYRCGQTYSQMPCAGGHVIDSSDPRSAAQRAEARRASERDKSLAEQMEQERRGAAAAAPVATAVDGKPALQGVAASAAAGTKRKDKEKSAKSAARAASNPGVLFITPRPPVKQ